MKKQNIPFLEDTVLVEQNISPTKILFAHHDSHILTMLSEMFELQSGNGKLILEFVNNGKQVLQKLSTTVFDIIVLDEDLTMINIPKFFHDLCHIYPHSKVIFLMNLIDGDITKANDISIIQYYRKPFTHRDLVTKINNTVRNTSLEMRHLSTADLILTLATINKKSALCLLNNQTGESGEVFIESRCIKYISVENESNSTFGQKALDKILKWESFEGCYSDASFPNEINIKSVDMVNVYNQLRSQRQKRQNERESKTDYLSKLCQPFSAEIQQRLRDLLAHVPPKITDGFVMNAFCNSQLKILSQLKNPTFDENLYRIGDSISDSFCQGMKVLKNRSVKYFTCQLPNSNFLTLHQIEREIWYFTIMNKQSSLSEDVLEVVGSFSNSISSILNTFSEKYQNQN